MPKPAEDVRQYAPTAVSQPDRAQGSFIIASQVYIVDLVFRFVLADTTQLHVKIGEMGQRIRQLEDALAIFQSGVSSDTHPLLRDELLSIKFGPDKGSLLEREDTSPDKSLDSIDALGTLTIGGHGQVKYFGRSAGSEVRFLYSLTP
ncbi:hypothetical protein H0H81_006607 [Sphagnurus paluster]|uniref:Uncharacterized protein n=1 Tax=Sphagnurus paluster TaxID=117069 RepID=A0A9P7K5F1_9AGAR|nr:hypothetical protein H0H81_006607 [Sphagnurus paluster]